MGHAVNELLGASDVATLLGVTRSAVSNYRTRGKLVPAAMIGNRPAYHRADVLALQRKPSGGNRPIVRGDDGRRNPTRRRAAVSAPGSWMPFAVESSPLPGRLPTLDETESAMR